MDALYAAAPEVADILGALVGLLGALIVHQECHPELYDNPSGEVVRQQVDAAVARVVPGSPAAKRLRRRG